jgi:hypothetical protein
MRARYAFCEGALLISFGQANVAMSAAMDMHEHCRSNKKGVLVDPGVLFLSHVR